MGKKGKTGKNRQDKFYHLAKEQGFRSRAAFKLVQLNKRHDFLSNAVRGVIDLCAAPGGWMQVARKHMPLGAPCIGIDLVPIRPVAGCVALVGDITADSTRAEVRRVLHSGGKSEKVDVVLNDGSPNMGKAWLQDAYTQSELTLAALRLASEFLSPGGSFISKVFRSNDYNSLLYVMHQLFQRVDATKPSASRTESAEIYVMCIGFKAPKSIDSRLLNPKFVFKDMSGDPKESENERPDLFLNTVLKDLKRQKRNRGGYDDGETILFKKASILQFCETSRPVALLVSSSQFSFDPHLIVEFGRSEIEAKRIAKLLENLPETTSEFLSCCDDLKVLARREFKLLLKWRLSARDALQRAELINLKANALNSLSTSGGDVSEDVRGMEETMNDNSEADISEDEDAELDEEVDKARKDGLAGEKRKRRKEKKMQKAIQRKIDMKIVLPDEEQSATNNTQDSLFSLKAANRLERHGLDIMDVPVDGPEAEKEEDGYDGDRDDLGADSAQRSTREPRRYEDPDVADALAVHEIEEDLDRWYKFYVSHKKTDKNGVLLKESKERKRVTKRRLLREALQKRESNDADNDNSNETVHLEVNSSASSDEEVTDDEVEFDEAPPGLESKQSRDAALWFSQPMFDDIYMASSDEESAENRAVGDTEVSEKIKSKLQMSKSDVHENFHGAAMLEAQRIAKEAEKEEENKIEGENDFEVVAEEAPVLEKDHVLKESDGESDSSFHSSDYDTDEKAEMVAIGRQMRKSKRNANDFLDDAYHRYTFDDPLDLPRWFADQDGEYRQRQMPVSKEQVEEMKAYIKSLEAAPTKREAEAKARRRARLAKKMEAMKAKANTIAENDDVSVNSRMRAIETLYKQAMKSGKSARRNKKKVYQVVRPGGRLTVGKNIGKNRNAVRGVRTTLVDRRMKADKRGIAKAQRKSNGNK